jgi:hypothetical protein
MPANAGILYLRSDSVRIGSSDPAIVVIRILVWARGDERWTGSSPGWVPDAGVCSGQSNGPF